MPYGYDNTTDARKVAQNQRALVTQNGDQLQRQYLDQYNQQQGGAPVNTVADTANYLNDIEDPLAHGQGGYNASESSQIQLSPEDKQNIISGAGISAGTNTAAQVGAADRATAAAGGNPLAMAAYRARAADTEGAQAGDAMTRARIGAKEAESVGAQTTGNARLAQQNQGLNYYSGQNSQANQNSQQANQLQASTYGTEANAGNAATSNTLSASQTPSKLDKIIGAGVGVASAFLADGDVPETRKAVVGENGPEWAGKPSYLDMGDPGSGEAPEFDGGTPSGQIQKGDDKAGVPFWQRLAQNAQQGQSAPSAQTPVKPWSPVDTYSGLGKAIGGLANKAFLDDGEMAADGDPAQHMTDAPYPPGVASVPPQSMLAEGHIFTKPTNVELGPQDAVIPLGYRAGAKARPSMALKKPMGRSMYGAAA
jgi:hypothetical protein